MGIGVPVEKKTGYVAVVCMTLSVVTASKVYATMALGDISYILATFMTRHVYDTMVSQWCTATRT